MVKNDNPRASGWQYSLATEMLRVKPTEPLIVPVRVAITIWMKRPASHYGTGRNSGKVLASAPAVPTVKPDADKVLRLILDAGTGIIWRDDSYVTDIGPLRKRYCLPGENPRTEVSMRTVWEDEV